MELKEARETAEVVRASDTYCCNETYMSLSDEAKAVVILDDRITELEGQRDELVKIAESRINAQSDLLVCYRIGKRPSEKLHGRLNKSGLQWEKIKQPGVAG